MNEDILDRITPSKETGWDIRTILPQRPPMLLVSEIREVVPGRRAVIWWNVDKDMEVFRGHFPGDPVLPGVYTVECMAQAADVLILTGERYRGKTPLFLGINNVRFFHKIVPGSTLCVEAVLSKEREEKAIITCHADVFTEGILAAEGEVTLAMR